MATEAQLRAQAKYDRANAKQVSIKLNRNTDADILDWLETQDNVQGYVKRLIRADMARADVLAQAEALDPEGGWLQYGPRTRIWVEHGMVRRGVTVDGAGNSIPCYPMRRTGVEGWTGMPKGVPLDDFLAGGYEMM